MLRVEEHRVDEHKELSVPGALLSKGALDRPIINQRLDVGPTVPLIARDSYVAETATKIDQCRRRCGSSRATSPIFPAR